jgi:hypothetical protein
LLGDPAIAALGANPDPKVRNPALREAAVRLASQGRWAEGAAIIRRAAPESAAAWDEAARLAVAKGADHDLAWARFLEAHAGELLFGYESGPYRGVSGIEESLPAGSPEKARIGDMLLRSSERWLALQAYARWLGTHAGPPNASPNAREVLGEADRVYNRLINKGVIGDCYFGRVIPASITAKDLRSLGARIRASAR